MLLLVALEGGWTWSSIRWSTTNLLPILLDKDEARPEGDVVALSGRTRQMENLAAADRETIAQRIEVSRVLVGGFCHVKMVQLSFGEDLELPRFLILVQFGDVARQRGCFQRS